MERAAVRVTSGCVPASAGGSSRIGTGDGEEVHAAGVVADGQHRGRPGGGPAGGHGEGREGPVHLPRGDGAKQGLAATFRGGVEATV